MVLLTESNRLDFNKNKKAFEKSFPEGGGGNIELISSLTYKAYPFGN